MTPNEIIEFVAGRTLIPADQLLGSGNNGPGGHNPKRRFARRMVSAWVSAELLNYVAAAQVLQRTPISVRASAIKVHENVDERLLLTVWRRVAKEEYAC